MTKEINSVDDIEEGDIISKGMQEFEVVDIRPEPDGFGPPFRATVEAQKDLGDFGDKGQKEELSKGDLLSGYEIIDES